MAIDALVAILTNIRVFAGNPGYATFLNWLDFLLLIAEIVVYATVIVMTLVGAQMETTVRAAVEEEHKKSEEAKVAKLEAAKAEPAGEAKDAAEQKKD